MKSCPNCGATQPWQRCYLRNGGFASWTCPECGSVLGFDPKRRGVLACLFLVLWMSFAMVDMGSGGFQSRMTYLSIVMLWVVVDIRFDRVVVKRRRGIHCRKCGYDLTGLRSTRCPECGESVIPADKTGHP
jgi:predicted RNA-binding Zn-ribbon protein involved in translation (DUF1610 family)